MAWLGLISLGLIAEVSVIIMLGRWGTDRYEAEQDQAEHGRGIASVVVHAADGRPAAGFPSVAEPEVA